MRFRIPNIDFISFLLGFILSSLIWWVVSMLRPAFQQIRTTAKIKRAEKREKIRSANAIEERYRQMVALQAQALHIAAPLFSLDEILVPPRLLAPSPRVEPGEASYTEDIVETTIPYLPAWPELASIYKAPTLTLQEALSGNSDIVLVGQAGTGKTVALASLASRLARRDPESGLPPETLPFLIHIADLDLPVNKDNPLNGLIEIVSEKASVFDLGRIPDFIRRAFSEGLALLLLDGTDELTPDGMKDAVEFIRAIKRNYPKTRMVTTGSAEFLDGLVSLNFIPCTLAAWDTDQRASFLEKWADLWVRHVAVETWAQTSDQVDPLLLNGWLNVDSAALTPLELTLKAWSAYAGDVRGPDPLDAIDSHVRRVTPVNIPREALESLALQACLAANPIFDPHKARQWVKSFEPNEPDPVEETVQGENSSKKSGKLEKQKAPSLGLITKMAESGLLSQHRKNRMRFIHPIFGGYLAGKPLASYTDAVLEQPPWIGKYLAMNFLAADGDATHLSNNLLSQLDRPLSRNLLVPARWLRDAPAQATWRKQVMAKLAELLRQNGQPLGLRGQFLAAFIQSGDPGAAVLFRQMLTEDNADLLQLAALGAGALGDDKSIDLLSTLLRNISPNVRRAACLALATIGTTAAMDVVASALLHGDEMIRRAAAEAMSLHTGEGHNMLREGAVMKDDVDVRRAVAYGLGRVRQPWAEELLNKLQLEDDQWVVRNAATEMLEDHRKLNRHIPRRLPPPSESPWLIAFAGKQGMGISPDKPPTDLLLMAFKLGEPEEKMASLGYLRILPSEGVFSALYQAMYGGDPELREAVFQTISEMAARGFEVPDPVQFGVGY
jgi:HEAT repeat protein